MNNALRYGVAVRFVYLVIALFFVGPTWAQSNIQKSVQGVFEISGTDPLLPDQELIPRLKSLFEDHAILAIGESVHGSQQVIQMQQRIIQSAVLHDDVRVIFLESKLHATEKLNDFLQTCKGDLPSILRSARFGAIEDEVTLFKWLCKFNQTHQNNPVQVMGVDIYHFSAIDYQWILDALEAGPEKHTIKNLLKQTHDVCIGFGKSQKQYMDEIYAYYRKTALMSLFDYQKCDSLLVQILDLLSLPALQQQNTMTLAKSRAFIRNTKALQWYWLNRFSLKSDIIRLWQHRDHAMANNLIDFWNVLGKPKSIWLAHTSHVAKSPAPFVKPLESDSDEQKRIVPAGVYLHQALQNQYKVIGFTGYDIDGMQKDFLAPTSEKSLDLYLKTRLGRPYLWIDLTQADDLFDQPWWLQHENGGDRAFDDGVWMNPTDHYDALIYLERSESSKMISRPSFLPIRDLGIPWVTE